ncbi:MAG: YkgJ family cysteine cluster protein [Oligoflexus sp.]
MSQRLQALQAKVDEKFKEIQDKYAEQMHCNRGCFQCCRAGLSVSKVEQQAISSFLLSHPERDVLVKGLAENPAHGKEFCPFLTYEGACSIYEVRPVICRSHGAPIKFKDGSSSFKRDVCTLNFQALPVDDIDENSVINIELLNTLLALINQTDCATDEATQRYPLSYHGIIDGEGRQNLVDIVSDT